MGDMKVPDLDGRRNVVGSRGWILAVVLAALMVAGVGGGVILAGGGKGDDDSRKGVASGAGLTARVAEILGLEESVVADAFESVKEGWDEDTGFVAEAAEILGVEESALEDALAQARREMANEAMRSRMDAMVEKGLLTREQADEYVSWFESRPAFLDRGVGFAKGKVRGWGGKVRGGKGGWKDGGKWCDKDGAKPEAGYDKDSSKRYTGS